MVTPWLCAACTSVASDGVKSYLVESLRRKFVGNFIFTMHVLALARKYSVMVRDVKIY